MILVDANVLLRLIQIGHPHRQAAIDARYTEFAVLNPFDVLGAPRR